MDGKRRAARVPAIGDRVPVTAHQRGSPTPRLLGHVEIEDLRSIVSRTATSRGPNGPQGPMTQFILAEAVRHLSEQLCADIRPRDGREPVPRVLSALIGHERFVEEVIGVSVNHMRRRWPSATDWYADLLAYVMRPSRHDTNYARLRESFPDWLRMPLGEFARHFAEAQIELSGHVDLFGLADTFRWLWPDHPAVRESLTTSLGALDALWLPVMRHTFEVYDLRPRPGIELSEMVWTMSALMSWESHQRSIDPAQVRYVDPTDGRHRSRTARSSLVYLQAAVEDLDGNQLTLAEIYAREPRREPDVALLAQLLS